LEVSTFFFDPVGHRNGMMILRFPIFQVAQPAQPPMRFLQDTVAYHWNSETSCWQRGSGEPQLGKPMVSAVNHPFMVEFPDLGTVHSSEN